MTLLCQRKMVKESWRLLYSKNEKCTKKGQRDQGKNVENELTERYLREEIGNERSVSRMRVPGLRVAESTATSAATSAPLSSTALSAARLRLQTRKNSNVLACRLTRGGPTFPYHSILPFFPPQRFSPEIHHVAPILCK